MHSQIVKETSSHAAFRPPQLLAAAVCLRMEQMLQMIFLGTLTEH